VITDATRNCALRTASTALPATRRDLQSPLSCDSHMSQTAGCWLLITGYWHWACHPTTPPQHRPARSPRRAGGMPRGAH
jgi:hypothetical protein